MPFKQVEVPAAVIGKGENGIDSLDSPDSREDSPTHWAENGGPHSDDYGFQGASTLFQSTSFEGSGGSDSSQCSSQLGRLSPLNLEEELASFGLTYTYPSHS